MRAFAPCCLLLAGCSFLIKAPPGDYHPSDPEPPKCTSGTGMVAMDAFGIAGSGALVAWAATSGPSAERTLGVSPGVIIGVAAAHAAIRALAIPSGVRSAKRCRRATREHEEWDMVAPE